MCFPGVWKRPPGLGSALKRTGWRANGLPASDAILGRPAPIMAGFAEFIQGLYIGGKCVCLGGLG